MAEPAPTPPPDIVSPVAITAWHWNAGRLAYPATDDGEPVWPPRAAAPGTGAQLTWTVSAGRGTVYAATAVHAREDDPRGIVLVDLDEGIRMMSRVVGIAARDVTIGQRVAVCFSDPDADGVRVPLFVPEGDA